MRPLLSRFILFLALLPLVQACQSEASTLAQEEPRRGAPVDVLELETTTFVDTFAVLGTAEPLETVQLSAEVPGRILQAYVEEGEAVRRGQPIFRIDVEVDQAGIDVLETQLQAAQRELTRLEALRAEGLATAQQLDRARTEVATVENNLRQRRLGVSRDLIASPIDGVLASRPADPGEYANPGAPLAEVIDYDTIVVHAQVPESELSYVQDRGDVDVFFPALNQTFTGQVHHIALRVSGTSRNFPVEIRLDNADRTIRPGMRARLHFERLRYENTVLLPRDAVLEGFLGREAMVLEDTNQGLRARVRPITLGPETRDRVVVLDGLSKGDRVILRGHRGLVDEARVEIVTSTTQASSNLDPSNKEEL